MEFKDFLQAIALGLVEGLTEFIPVSSTGHLLLAGHFLNFQSTGRAFEVLIQLGAILALLSVYSVRLTKVVVAAPSDPNSRKFLLGVLVAVLPAAFVGVIAHDFIKRVLFETPVVVCSTLVVGGIALLIVDRMKIKVKHTNSMEFPISLCFKIGFCQTLALIPGVSRSGATIVSALLMGADKRSAAEFSFFLAMPTMAGAFAFDLLKSFSVLSATDAWKISVGFIAAFISGIIVVRWLLDYVEKRGFSLFAWWRITLGALGFIGIYVLQ